MWCSVFSFLTEALFSSSNLFDPVRYMKQMSQTDEMMRTWCTDFECKAAAMLYKCCILTYSSKSQTKFLQLYIPDSNTGVHSFDSVFWQHATSTRHNSCGGRRVEEEKTQEVSKKMLKKNKIRQPGHFSNDTLRNAEVSELE